MKNSLLIFLLLLGLGATQAQDTLRHHFQIQGGSALVLDFNNTTFSSTPTLGAAVNIHYAMLSRQIGLGLNYSFKSIALGADELTETFVEDALIDASRRDNWQEHAVRLGLYIASPKWRQFKAIGHLGAGVSLAYFPETSYTYQSSDAPEDSYLRQYFGTRATGFSVAGGVDIIYQWTPTIGVGIGSSVEKNIYRFNLDLFDGQFPPTNTTKAIDMSTVYLSLEIGVYLTL